MKTRILPLIALALAVTAARAQPPSEGYRLVWSDEFNGASLDLDKWGYRALGPRRDAINVKECVELDGKGHLRLWTRKVGDRYHTAMIGTQGKFEACFGYFECRMRFQKEPGHWAAFWLQSPTVGQVGDPRKNGTEIDVIEYLARYPEVAHVNLHWDGYGEHHRHAGTKFHKKGLDQGFHLVGLEWKPEEYVFYIDGEVAWRTKQAVSHRKQYIILSLEVGKWAGDIDDAGLPDGITVDYVRVYQRAAQGSLSDLQHEFRDPPFRYKSRPLWFWNGPLSAAETKAIMKQSKSSGYSGFGILPSRGMSPAFMTPEFLAHYKTAVETAAELGQKMCLYDEYFFPSGYAGGLLAKRYPGAVAKRLDMVVQDLTGPRSLAQPLPQGTFMGAVAMQQNTKERIDISNAIRDKKLVWKVPPGPWKVLLFTCVPDTTKGKGLVDYLSPEAVKRFIELTYEKYYASFPNHFGTTIDSAFYDEPTFHWVEGGRAWTEAFNARFEAKYGFSPVPLYPALWYDIGPETAAARNALFGLRAELYATGFPKVVNEWCRAHGIELTGHVDQEEMVNPVGLCGDLMKSFEHQDMPGIDQIFRYGRASKAYKVVSSAAYNYDKRLVVTECYGAIKRMPVANLYKEAMDQFAKGINYMVPHAVWYSSSNITFEPELSCKSSVYGPALPAYNTYIGRLQRLLQEGRHVADIGVLYPIATLQAGYRFGVGVPYHGGVVPEEADYMDLGEILALGIRRDFTFVHPEVLDEKCTVTGNTIQLRAKIHPQEYRVFVLPGSKVIHWSNLKRIKSFYDEGGTVLATTQLPYQSAEFGKDAEVRQAIRSMFGRDPQEPMHPVASASSSWEAGGHGPERAVDGDPETRWNAADGTSGDQWLEIDFGAKNTVTKTTVKEAFGRATAYAIEYWDGSSWKACATGTTIGTEKTEVFSPVATSKVRLYVKTIASDSVSIAEFEVYDDEGENLAQRGEGYTRNTNVRGGKALFAPRPTAAVIQKMLDEANAVYDVEFEENPAISGGNLSYIHKVVRGSDVYFFANSSDTEVTVPVRLRGKRTPALWDPHSGEMRPCEFSHANEAGQAVTQIRLRLPPVRSVFVISTPRPKTPEKRK